MNSGSSSYIKSEIEQHLGQFKLRIFRGRRLLNLFASADCVQAQTILGRATVLFNGLEEACKSLESSDHFFELLNYVVASCYWEGRRFAIHAFVRGRCQQIECSRTCFIVMLFFVAGCQPQAIQEVPQPVPRCGFYFMVAR